MGTTRGMMLSNSLLKLVDWVYEELFLWENKQFCSNFKINT